MSANLDAKVLIEAIRVQLDVVSAFVIGDGIAKDQLKDDIAKLQSLNNKLNEKVLELESVVKLLKEKGTN